MPNMKYIECAERNNPHCIVLQSGMGRSVSRIESRSRAFGAAAPPTGIREFGGLTYHQYFAATVRGSELNIGHIILGNSCDDIGAHFVALVEALANHGIKQHVLCSERSLADRLALCDRVGIGPIVGSSLMAACYMPRVDLVHVHDHRGRQAALLMALTRSIPFVMSRRSEFSLGNSQLNRSVYRRASGLICQTDAVAKIMLGYQPKSRVDVIADIPSENQGDGGLAANRVASEHMRVYRRAIDSWSIPALLS